MTDRAREHGLLTLLFVLSRVGLAIAGLRFSYRFDWLFFADPSDLRERLAETLVHFQLYPPGMNLLAGTLLAVGGGETSARLLFAGAGVVLVNSLFYVLRSLGIPMLAAFVVTLVFALIPSTVYFEHSFTDTFPSGVLCMLAAALLHRAVLRSSFASWTAFFSTLALLCLVRSTFHLAWFALLFGGTLALVTSESRALVFKAALVPLLVVTLVYTKNLVLFGFFGSGSHTGFAYHALTNRVLGAEKATFIGDGRVSTLAALPVYAPPGALEPYFAAPAPSLSPLLTSFERTTVAAPNYNHLFLLDAGAIHKADARRAVLARPLSYAREVLETLVTFFGPSTRYHPRDDSPNGPHHEHRRVLDKLETAFDAVMHRFPLSPAGLYILLPLPLAWAARRAGKLLGNGHSTARAEAILLVFCVTQICYVAVFAALSISTESARYRYSVEPLVWLVVTLAVRHALAKVTTNDLPRGPEEGDGQRKGRSIDDRRDLRSASR